MNLQKLKNRIVLLLEDATDLEPEAFLAEVDKRDAQEVLDLLNALGSVEQKALHAQGNPQTDAVLSCHKFLCAELVEKLEIEYGQNIARYHEMDEALFDALIDRFPLAMASNQTISFAMQRRVYCYTDDVQQALAENPTIHKDMVLILFETNKPPVKIALAKNPATPVNLLEQMQGDKKFYKALAGNEKTPAELLKGLAQSDDVEVLLAIAKNSTAPKELLDVLKKDSRLKLAVEANPSY